MATYATDLSVLTACDAVNGWSELPAPHASGSAPGVETENYFHNAISVSQATGQALNDGAGIQFDNGAALTWTATSNWVLMFWTYYAAPTNLKTWTTGGMRLGIGSADDNAYFYNAMGNNFGKYPYGGWQNTAIDPEFATADFTLGTPGATYQNFAVLPNVTAKITKGAPVVVDVLRYGRGEFQVTGTAATFSGMATANDNATTGRWGLFQSEGGSNYLWKGLISLGLTATTVTFSDSNTDITLEDTPRVLAGFNKIEINNASSSITWTTVNIKGRALSITGSAPVSPGDFEVVDNSTVALTTCAFTDLGTFIFQSNTSVDVCTFRRCGQITVGGSLLDTCTIDSSIAAVSTIVTNLNELIDCSFASDGSNHAVDLGTITSTQSMNWNNYLTNYATADGSTGNEAILVSVDSGIVLTISVGAGYSTPYIYNTGLGTVTVVSGQATYTQTMKDQTTLAAIQGVAVTVKPLDATGPWPYQESVTITSATGTATVIHTAHGFSIGHKVEIDGANENEYNRIKTILTVPTANSYTYAISGTPASPATGTIISTTVIVDALTDVNGQVSDTRGYGGTNQPINGNGKKGSSVPVYKSAPITGIIDSANGVSITTLMIPD